MSKWDRDYVTEGFTSVVRKVAYQEIYKNAKAQFFNWASRSLKGRKSEWPLWATQLV
ncbi:hypothetical protein MUTS10_01550 (plasmid) [Escherichia coli]|uniref:hypothetical protein n=1 Tax=Escherichia coli TaxID=562 RepID=UPI00155DC99D|nr:hypothetical protein [Escherichia coli]BDY51829.1 hypothetical protein MUTS5_03030 [Escherichia coli]BDY71506.1 hypothetical protein MUTS9_00880 [Escherichia coli]BDY76823.1 hypothetical protein MUTS10_01550 [Escherichia coli]BDY81835.1 hypothetical protein MUTS11_01500 [Escherichia coli]